MSEKDGELSKNLKYKTLAIKLLNDVEKARDAGIKKLQKRANDKKENVTLFTSETIRKYSIKIQRGEKVSVKEIEPEEGR